MSHTPTTPARQTARLLATLFTLEGFFVRCGPCDAGAMGVEGDPARSRDAGELCAGVRPKIGMKP
jgi:hypothetical protein